jgi:hypothetical protein
MRRAPAVGPLAPAARQQRAREALLPPPGGDVIGRRRAGHGRRAPS